VHHPPIEHNLDESTDIEATEDGFALVTPLVRVNLNETLAGRFAVNVAAAQRRAAAAS
jgi:hypothetical protein